MPGIFFQIGLGISAASLFASTKEAGVGASTGIAGALIFNAGMIAATLFIHPALFTAATLLSILQETRLLTPSRKENWSPAKHSALLRLGPLERVTRARFLTAAITIPLAFLNPWLTLPILLATELSSRHLFFRSVYAPKMPGSLHLTSHN